MSAGKILFHSADFFSLNQKNLAVEADAITNRTYFIHKDRIVAVAEYVEPEKSNG